MPTARRVTGAGSTVRIANLDILVPRVPNSAPSQRQASFVLATGRAHLVFSEVVDACAPQRGERRRIVKTATTATSGRAVRVSALALRSPVCLAVGTGTVFLVAREMERVSVIAISWGLAALSSAHSAASVMALVSAGITIPRCVNATSTGPRLTVSHA